MHNIENYISFEKLQPTATVLYARITVIRSNMISIGTPRARNCRNNILEFGISETPETAEQQQRTAKFILRTSNESKVSNSCAKTSQTYIQIACVQTLHCKLVVAQTTRQSLA